MLNHLSHAWELDCRHLKLQCPTVIFNSKNKVLGTDRVSPDALCHPCMFQYNNAQWPINLFTLDAIISNSGYRSVHFNPKAITEMPKKLCTKATAEDLHHYLHYHGQLQVGGTSSFNICLCRTKFDKGQLKVTQGDDRVLITYRKPIDILMVQLAIQSMDVVMMLGSYNFAWLKQWIRNTVACCIPCTSSTYFPIFSCIEQLAQHIITASSRVDTPHTYTLKQIVLACEHYIQTHLDFQKELHSKAGHKTLFTFKAELQVMQEVVCDTLLELLSLSADKTARAQQQFLQYCRVPCSNKDALHTVLGQVFDEDLVHLSEPIIKYPSLADITHWESYCQYCDHYGITLYAHTTKRFHLEDKPAIFHLINRLIIEKALSLHKEDDRCINWSSLLTAHDLESKFLGNRSQELLLGIHDLCDQMKMPRWDNPFAIDFQQLRSQYDALPPTIRTPLNKNKQLAKRQFHQYINFAEFAIESARLGTFRIPAPIPSELPHLKRVLKNKISELTKDCPSHKELFIQRLYLLTPLITLLEIL